MKIDKLMRFALLVLPWIIGSGPNVFGREIRHEFNGVGSEKPQEFIERHQWDGLLGCFLERLYDTSDGQQWFKEKSLEFSECGVVPVTPIQERFELIGGGACWKKRLYRTPNGTEWVLAPRPLADGLMQRFVDALAGNDAPWYPLEACVAKASVKESGNKIKPATQVIHQDDESNPRSVDGAK